MAATACRSKLLYPPLWPRISHRTCATPLIRHPRWKSTESKVAAGKRSVAERSTKKTDSEALEQELETLKYLRKMPSVYPSTDVWGVPVVKFDVQIPYDMASMLKTLFVQRPYDSRKVKQLKDVWFAVKHNLNNRCKNIFSMFTIARADAFPGLKNVQLRFRPSVWRRLSNVQSYDPSSWLAPLRKIAMDTYRQTNMAVARQNEDVVKGLTVTDFQTKTIQLMRRRNKAHRWFWDITSDTSDAAFYVPDSTFTTRLRSLISWVLRRNFVESVVPPVTIVSIRATEVYLAEQDPKIGNRLVIQALVKFDTTQVLHVRDRQGKPVESELSKPHRVVQYIVMEKVGWYDCPWKFKEQIFRA